jgi:hypothetical protein
MVEKGLEEDVKRMEKGWRNDGIRTEKEQNKYEVRME